MLSRNAEQSVGFDVALLDPVIGDRLPENAQFWPQSLYSSFPIRATPRQLRAIASIDHIKTAAEVKALKSTPLVDAKIYIAGDCVDIQGLPDGSKYDLWIAGVGALCLIFIIMLAITRSLIADFGYRGYGRTFVGRIVWAVSADLAIYPRLHIALDGASDVRDHPFGGGV